MGRSSNHQLQLKSANKELSRVVYTPQSQLRHPVLLFQQMWRDLLASRELAWQLMVRDISARYSPDPS